MVNFEEFFKALGDETRLRIINVLLNSKPVRVTDLVNALKIPQSTASRHLAMLRRLGWVEDRRIDKWVYYRLGVSVIPELKTALKIMFENSVSMKNDLKNLENIT